MKAILVRENERLEWTDVEDPQIGKDEVLVKTAYAAVNRADLMQRAGDYPPPPSCPEWMGLEIAGEIMDMGEIAKEKSNFHIGDKVCALLGGGGYAEYAAVKYDMLMPIPENVGMVEAAAMPEAFATAYLNLFIEGKMHPGDTVLMQAGASGLASVVIPMAKAFGARVLTTIIDEDKRAAVEKLGADLVVNTKTESLKDVLAAELAAGHPVTVTIDCLGGAGMGECLPYMAHGGRWIVIAALAGRVTEIDLKNIYVRNLRIIGSTLRSRTPAVKAEILRSLVRDVWGKVSSGKVRPTVDSVLPITEAEAAHALLSENKSCGKVVLRISD